LGQRASQLFPSINPETLRGFSETYGHGAFVCRYMHCLRVARGFDSSKQRDAHEATHERKFRCAYSTCVSFSAGFATKSALKRHNDKYHTTVNTRSSLSETINRVFAKDNMPTDGSHDDSAGESNVGNEPTMMSAQQDQRRVESERRSLFQSSNSYFGQSYDEEDLGRPPTDWIRQAVYNSLKSQTGFWAGWQVGFSTNYRMNMMVRL